MKDNEWQIFLHTLRIALSNIEDHDRRSRLMSKAGRMMELRAEWVLKHARYQNGNKIFRRVVRHDPNSSFDRAGKDFSVSMRTNGHLTTRSFGITLSPERRRRSTRKHRSIPQLYFPLRISEQEIIEKVIGLFVKH